MDALIDKPDWHLKVFDNEVVAWLMQEGTDNATNQYESVGLVSGRTVQ
jgi:hypothetical protein